MAKKNNTAKKAALQAEQISEALKKSTQNALQDMLNEAISNTLMENAEEDCKEEDVEDNDSDEYTVEDEPTNVDVDDDCDDDECDDEECADGSCDIDTDDDDVDDDLEDYKVGDNDYDLTNVEGDEVLKVYNKLGDDDQIFITPEGDGKYDFNDDETGAEYEIELGDDAVEGLDDDADDMTVDINDEDDFEDEEPLDDEGDDFEVELGDDDVEDDDDFENEEPLDDEGDDFEVELGDDDVEDDEDFDDEEPLDDEDDTEIEIEDDDDDDVDIELDDEDDEEMLQEEDLGYTTNYQKDVMPGLKMNEPADSKTTNNWDAGAPKGNSRPYSGYKNAKSNLFTKSVNECGNMPMNGELEETLRRSYQPERNKNDILGKHKKEYTQNSHQGPKNLNINEKLYKAAKKIQAENKQYAKAIAKIKKSLYEAATLNVKLAQVVKLLSENTTTRDEKKNIVEAFDKAKTIRDAKALYEGFSRQLNEAKKGNMTLDRNYGNKETLNETTIYNDPSLAMMSRMDALDNLWKNNK